MLTFETEQKIFEIGGFKIGGQPGQLPTVLIGNLFYRGMPEVSDHKQGAFDEKSVLSWIRSAEELSERTGVPHFLDIMAAHPEAMRNYVTFISDHSESVFLIDGADLETRVAGLSVVGELGLQNRMILNGVFPQISEEEIEAIRGSGMASAIVFAYNEMDFSAEGRTSALRGFGQQAGLLEIADRAGIENLLVDTIVFDVPSITYAAEAIKLVKGELGYPSGCSPANATYCLRGKQDKRLVPEFTAYNASVHSVAQFCGADFLIYGPVKQAKNIIPTCAMNDALLAYYNMKKLGVKPLISTHPLYKIL
ncbi:MAG: tetrahydromethanopterin S-methyltransferase subunit H [Candidatus Bathyarchaeota archaeon]|nr:MAG: tetrahydromethanopterin S-methyltransferase subunit H [Candidatus Bathyarchaeota archaeon]